MRAVDWYRRRLVWRKFCKKPRKIANVNLCCLWQRGILQYDLLTKSHLGGKWNMFNENLRELRKSKGFTQEELATKVNVVRQTVSKWEKGLSVPDADSLQKIAEVLEVDVSQLLGAKIETEESRNEIAEQLSRINEQLVIKNRRTKKIIKVICLILFIPAIFIVISIILARLFFGFDTASGSEPVEEIGYEEYEDIEYDEIIEE